MSVISPDAKAFLLMLDLKCTRGNLTYAALSSTGNQNVFICKMLVVQSKPGRDPLAVLQPAAGCETEMFFEVSITQCVKREDFIHMFSLYTF